MDPGATLYSSRDERRWGFCFQHKELHFPVSRLLCICHCGWILIFARLMRDWASRPRIRLVHVCTVAMHKSFWRDLCNRQRRQMPCLVSRWVKFSADVFLFSQICFSWRIISHNLCGCFLCLEMGCGSGIATCKRTSAIVNQQSNYSREQGQTDKETRAFFTVNKSGDWPHSTCTLFSLLQQSSPFFILDIFDFVFILYIYFIYIKKKNSPHCCAQWRSILLRVLTFVAAKFSAARTCYGHAYLTVDDLFLVAIYAWHDELEDFGPCPLSRNIKHWG